MGNSNSTCTFPTQTTSSSHNPEFLTKKMLCCCAQLWPTLCDPMDCSPTGINVHGIFQARILEWVAIPFSRESSPPRDQTEVACITGGFFTNWAIREALMHQTVVKSTLEGTKLNGLLYLRSLSNYNMLLCSAFLQEVMKFTDFLRHLTSKNTLYTQSNFVVLHSTRHVLQLV